MANPEGSKDNYSEAEKFLKVVKKSFDDVNHKDFKSTLQRNQNEEERERELADAKLEQDLEAFG